MDSATSGPLLVREGDHLDIPNRTFLPYRHIKALGMGGSAFIEMVQDETNGRVFALKHFRRYHGPNLNEFKRGFRNEVDILRRLSSHPHIIRVFATWACGRELGIILTPVADNGDLACYLQAILDLGSPPTTEQCTVLNRAFGCLASGLAFIHKQTIRHKDIKPQNILIHQGCIIYTDFGIALDSSQLENTTTVGTAQAFTFRYCAPEVAHSDMRNRKSDVFSLGCVFTEILAVLEPQIQLGRFGTTAYHKIIDDLRDVLNYSKRVSPQRSQLFRACLNMLERRPQDRISAEGLLKELGLLRNPKENTNFEYFCNTCAPVKEPENTDMATVVLGEPGNSMPVASHLSSVSEINTEEVPRKVKHQDAFSSTATGADQQARQDTQGGLEVHRHRAPLVQIIKGHSDTVWGVAFSPDGKLLASASNDRTVRLWDSATAAPRGLLEGHSDIVDGVAFSPDGKLLASASHDGTVRLWDSATAALRGLLEGHSSAVGGVAFSPDGKLLASASDDRTVMLWDSATAAPRGLLEGHSSAVWGVAFSPDGKLLASASLDRTVMLWDSATAAPRGLLEGHSGGVWGVAFSPDGKLLASASDDRTVRLWDSAAATATPGESPLASS